MNGKILVVFLLMLAFVIFACGNQEPIAPELVQSEDSLGEITNLQKSGVLLFGSSFFGSNGLSTLYHIDSGTGAATAIGSIGFERVGAMDFHPSTGVLYATAERADGSDTPVLITIDISSGAGTEVGPTGINGTVGDVSFRRDGMLFVYDANASDHTLYTVDLSTGAASLVGSTGLSFNSGNGITFVPRAGRDAGLFHSNRDFSHELSQSTGSATQVANMTFPANCAGTGFARIAAADFSGSSHTVFGVMKCGGPGNESLGTVDYTTGIVTEIGSTAGGMDAIAVRN